MSDYSQDHASAYQDIKDAGSDMVFTAPDGSTIAGVAIRVGGNSSRYQSLSLKLHEDPTFLFVPNNYAELPEAGYVGLWNEKKYTVAEVQPIAPNGDPILSRVVCSA